MNMDNKYRLQSLIKKHHWTKKNQNFKVWIYVRRMSCWLFRLSETFLTPWVSCRPPPPQGNRCWALPRQPSWESCVARVKPEINRPWKMAPPLPHDRLIHYRVSCPNQWRTEGLQRPGAMPPPPPRYASCPNPSPSPGLTATESIQNVKIQANEDKTSWSL